MKKRVFLMTAAVCAATLASGCRHEAPEPWEKFVNARGQVWPTNGVCDHTHIGEFHITESDWEGRWIEILKKAGSPDDDPVFTVKVAPGIRDGAAWNALELKYEAGVDTSNMPFPVCSPIGDGTGGSTGQPERLVGEIPALTHTAEGESGPISHKVYVYLWQPTTAADGTVYGPVEIVFWHPDLPANHNGIVH